MGVLPIILPSSMRVDVIADPQVRTLLGERQSLQERRNTILKELRKVLYEINTCRTEHALSLNTFHSEVTATIEVLELKKNSLAAELDELSSVRYELSTVRQAMWDVKRYRGILMNEIQEIERALQVEMEEYDRLCEERATLASHLRFTTMEHVEQELRRINQQAEKFAFGDSSVLLEQDRLRIERARQKLQKVFAFDERIAAQNNLVDNYHVRLAAKTSELRAKEEEEWEMSEKLRVLNSGNDSAKWDARFYTLCKELDEVQRELRLALCSRKKCLPKNEEIGVLLKRSKMLGKELSAVDKRFAELENQVPCYSFVYDPKLKSALVGRGGATLEQLQADFDVAVCIDGLSSGKGVVVGCEKDANAAITAITEIIDAENTCSDEIVLPYVPALRKRRLGAIIRSIERDSGASVQVENNSVKFCGTLESVDAARKLLLCIIGSKNCAESLSELVEDQLVVDAGEDAVVNHIGENTDAERFFPANASAHVVAPSGTEVAAEDESLVKGGQLQEKLPCDKTAAHDVVVLAPFASQGVGDATCMAGSGREGDRVTLHDTSQYVELRFPAERTLMRFLTTAFLETGLCHDLNEPEEKRENKEDTADKKIKNDVECEAEEVEGDTMEQRQARRKRAPAKRLLTPLKVVQHVSQCEFMTPLRKEGVILMRGKREHVIQARMMLRDFALRYCFHTVDVYVPEVLFTYLTQQSGKALPLVKELFTGCYSPFLHLQLKPEKEIAVISSLISEEVAMAAKSLQELVAEKEATSVRRVCPLSQDHISALLGSDGKKLYELEKSTGTRIIVRPCHCEIQIFNSNGDEKALNNAVDAIVALANEKN